MRELSQVPLCPIPEILEDWRWGFCTLYVGKADEPLLIHAGANTCAGFIGRRCDGHENPVGTCFFVNYVEGDHTFLYLVTARHLIDNTRKKDWSDDQIVYLQLNATDGTRHKTITSTPDNWINHPTDENIDVAVLPFRALSSLGHTGVPCGLDPEVIAAPQKWGVRAGTDVFITGLFLRHYGTRRHIPIIRTGTIAAMPEEPIEMGEKGEGKWVPAYLIETHSIGGLSGSPVFANPIDLNSAPDRVLLQARHIWIGLVSAHWQFDADNEEQSKINSGIAIVSPRESVLEVLQHPRLIEMREQEVKRKRKGSAPTLDNAGGPTQQTHAPKKEDRIDIPIPTRGQFERDLAKATRKRDK
jgi:Trypsin-like peptidase domain